ncbi:MAG: NAD-dependent epimerase/dehydratase family protein [Alphaproteobacteria bacterium]|nr:NAD-dependent epimerase/dehydratase family protein [Alphaproteobacteria bacterium]
MNIVVIGGTGYLGAKIVRLLYRTHDVCVVRRENGNLSRLKDILSGLCVLDIDDMADKFPFDRVDLLLNFSCAYPRDGKSDAEVFEANLHNPLKVFLKCLSAGLHRVITIGTGLPDNLNTYTIAKAKLLDILKWYQETADFKFVNILLENFYGADEPANRFIGSLIRDLLKNKDVYCTIGDQRRDFVHIDDVITSVMTIIKADYPKPFTEIPLGTGENISIKDLVLYLKDITHSSSVIHFGAVPKRALEPSTIADRDKMKIYGIQTRFSIKSGLEDVVSKLKGAME